MNGRAQGGYWFKAALRDSDLAPLTRLVGCMLESVADTDSGIVPASASLSTIAKWTGMSRRAVVNHLQLLEDAGFVRRSRPEQWRAAKNQETTRYTLLVPEAFPVRRPSASGALGHEATEPSAPRAPDLVHQTTAPSAPRAPSTTSTKTRANGGGPRARRLCPNGQPIAADGACCEACAGGAALAIEESA